MCAEHKASIHQRERELCKDITVDLEEDSEGSWGGSIELNHLRQQVAVGEPYELKLDDGRSGTIFLLECDSSAEVIDPWVPFRGSGTLS
jgi:hypothetical protein